MSAVASRAARPVARVLALVVALGLVACTGGEDRGASPSAEPTRTTPEPSSAPTPAHDKTSLPALFEEEITGTKLRTTGAEADLGAYTRQGVRYRSGELTISGQIFVPDGDGPFPAVVLNHGYIDPEAYVTGQGMPREQDALARAGFVVLHTDYRGHAGSDDTTALDLEMRLGYTRDTIAAVKALKRRPDVDPGRVAMVGRSMGGGVTLNALVTDPDVVDAAVVYASVSSRFEDNFKRWTEKGRPARAARIEDRWGSAKESPDFWDNLSSRSFFSRVDVPVLMHHGTADASCPYSWATATRRALKRAGADVRLATYEGEGHTFAPRWRESMDLTITFLKAELD